MEKAFFTIVISVVVVNCGVLFENKTWVKWAEWIRIVSYPVILIVLTILYSWPPVLLGIAGVYFIISFTWFYSITKNAALQTA